MSGRRRVGQWADEEVSRWVGGQVTVPGPPRTSLLSLSSPLLSSLTLHVA